MGWKPKRKAFCPPAGWDFVLLEAAAKWGYASVSLWNREHPLEKARVLYWYLLKNVREGYEQEKQEEAAEAKAKEDEDKKKGGGKVGMKNNPAVRYGRDLLADRARRAQRG